MITRRGTVAAYVALLLLVWLASYSAALNDTTIALLDSTWGIHGSAGTPAQYWSDRASVPSLELAMSFPVPTGNWACNRTLAITGAFCITYSSASGTAPSPYSLPTSMTFTLASGGADTGPQTNIAAWALPINRSGDLAQRLAQATPVTLSIGLQRACVDNATFLLSLRIFQLRALAGTDVYWLTGLAGTPNTTSLLFLWRTASGPAAAIPPTSNTGTQRAVFRDIGNLTGYGFTQWTPLQSLERAVFGAAPADSAHVPYVNIVAQGCTGNFAWPVAPPVSVAFPSPRAAPATTEPTSGIGAPPVLDPVPRPWERATPSNNSSDTGPLMPGAVRPPTLTTWLIVVIAVSSCLVFLIFVGFGVLLVRRWRDKKRLSENMMSAAEFFQQDDASFMTFGNDFESASSPGSSSNGAPLSRSGGYTRMSSPHSNEDEQTSVVLTPRPSDTASSEEAKRLKKSTQGTKRAQKTISEAVGKTRPPRLPPLNLSSQSAAPSWIPSEDIFTEIDLDNNAGRPLSARSTGSTRSRGLIDDDDDEDDIVVMRVETPRAYRPSSAGMRRTSSTGDVRDSPAPVPFALPRRDNKQ